MCGFGVRCVLLPAFGGDEPFRVGVGAFHVDDPFAAPSGVFCRSGRGGVELTFEVGIDAAFEPVGVVGRSVLLEVGEEHAVALHRDDAEVGAAQPFMGPPPCAPRLGLGVVGIGPGVRAFLDVAAVARVPVVGPRHPCGGLPGPVDAGQFPDMGEQFAAGLALGVARQVGERVAQRVHQAALRRRARPQPRPRPSGRRGRRRAPTGPAVSVTASARGRRPCSPGGTTAS